MTTQGEISRIIEISESLTPREVAAEVSLMTGARLKAWNADSGPSGNAVDSPMLFGDKVDKWAASKSRRYRASIATARKALEQALFIQGQVLAAMHDEDGNPTEEAQRLAAEDVGPQAETCSNLSCGRVVERTATDRLRAGRCSPCYRYFKKHGTERLAALVEAAA